MSPENDTSSAKPFASLHGKRAVVTGSSSGIGRAIAIELAAAGADVMLHARRPRSGVQQSARAVRALGRECVVILADLAKSERLAPFVVECWNQWQGVDIWVNNAGVDLLTGAGAKFDYARKLAALWEVDVRGTLLLCKDVGARMCRAGGGVLLNIGWDQADRGMGGDSGELFAAAKNAVMGATRSLAVSLAPKVRVNCIAPGWIRTAWGEQASSAWQERVIAETPLQRWGTSEDIARLARFLVSDEAAYITGQVINANGGAVR
jgi:3-oxoacyl-[acyl-carrier protein] reductase